MSLNTKSGKNLFIILSILMGAIIIASNYLVQFPINKFNLQDVLTYGAFSYPVTFLITDLANRRFGKKIPIRRRCVSGARILTQHSCPAAT